MRLDERRHEGTMSRHYGRLGAICLALCLSAGVLAAATSEPDDPWAGLARDIFKGRPLADGAGLLSMATAFRAEARDTEGHVFRGEWPIERTDM
jgi:hypothetical protein